MPKTTLPKNIELSGPYYTFSSPWGSKATLQRDEWFLSRNLTEEELKTASKFDKACKSISLGRISCFHNNKQRFVINQLYPAQAFNTLQKAVDYLIENEDKLVFCT